MTKIRVDHNDGEAGIVYYAVGKALSTWEALEFEMSIFYFYFNENKPNLTDIDEFGSKFRITSERLNAVANSATKYFIKNPNQEIEAEFENILKRIKDMSIERHRIAHGILTIVAKPRYSKHHKLGVDIFNPFETEYRLGAPWYALRRLKTHQHGISVDEIREKEKIFSQILDEVRNFRAVRFPD